MTNNPDPLVELRKMVDEQAEDEGLWFVARAAPEAYLQQELRRLHAAIEEEAKERPRPKGCEEAMIKLPPRDPNEPEICPECGCDGSCHD